ncbi:hypothetical protein QL285_061785 [Trifolium repens]|nr:hypothetical protein QL285_061785 [Trifolium repens]
MKKKRSYIVPRRCCIVPRCDGYLFEENMRNFGNKSDPIVLRDGGIVTRCMFVRYRATMEIYLATMENPSPLIKTINRVLLFHNYSFFTIHNISQKGR